MVKSRRTDLIGTRAGYGLQQRKCFPVLAGKNKSRLIFPACRVERIALPEVRLDEVRCFTGNKKVIESRGAVDLDDFRRRSGGLESGKFDREQNVLLSFEANFIECA